MRKTTLGFGKCLHFTNVFGNLYHYVRIMRFPGVYSAVNSVPQTPWSIFRWKLALKRRVSDRSTSTNYDFLCHRYIYITPSSYIIIYYICRRFLSISSLSLSHPPPYYYTRLSLSTGCQSFDGR